MNMAGIKNLFAFDFDDTLMWAPDWHSDVEVDQNNIVMSPGSSFVIKSALDFIDGFKSLLKQDYVGETPEKLMLRKIETDMPNLGKHNQVVFVITGDVSNL